MSTLSTRLSLSMYASTPTPVGQVDRTRPVPVRSKKS